MSDVETLEKEGCHIIGLSAKVEPMVSSIKSVKVFRVLVNFDFANYYFYFLKGEASAIFLSIIGEKATTEEMSVNVKGKKYYLTNADNSLGQQIQVEERDGEGVRKSFETLKEKLNVFLSGLSPLEIGLAETAILEELGDCHT